MKTPAAIDSKANPGACAFSLVNGAQCGNQTITRDRAVHGKQIDGIELLVRTGRRPAHAGIERRIAIGRNDPHITNRRLDVIADEAQHRDNVRPVVVGWSDKGFDEALRFQTVGDPQIVRGNDASHASGAQHCLETSKGFGPGGGLTAPPAELSLGRHGSGRRDTPCSEHRERHNPSGPSAFAHRIPLFQPLHAPREPHLAMTRQPFRRPRPWPTNISAW